MYVLEITSSPLPIRNRRLLGQEMIHWRGEPPLHDTGPKINPSTSPQSFTRHAMPRRPLGPQHHTEDDSQSLRKAFIKGDTVVLLDQKRHCYWLVLGLATRSDVIKCFDYLLSPPSPCSEPGEDQLVAIHHISPHIHLQYHISRIFKIKNNAIFPNLGRGNNK